jgi:hypothetical protein
MNKDSETIIIEIPIEGTWVWKYDLRSIIGVNIKGWSEEIKIIEQNNPDFADSYIKYKNYRRVPIALAKVIILHVYQAMGEEIIIKPVIRLDK